jgi:hypothetical protein
LSTITTAVPNDVDCFQSTLLNEHVRTFDRPLVSSLFLWSRRCLAVNHHHRHSTTTAPSPDHCRFDLQTGSREKPVPWWIIFTAFSWCSPSIWVSNNIISAVPDRKRPPNNRNSGVACHSGVDLEKKSSLGRTFA